MHVGLFYMNTLVLLLAISMLCMAMFWHALAQANVINKVKTQWFERLFISRRAPSHNLNEEGKHYRKKSNWAAVGGFLMVVIYLLLRQSNG